MTEEKKPPPIHVETIVATIAPVLKFLLPMVAIFVGSATYICYKVAIFGNELFSYKAKVSSSQSKTLWLYNERASISQ